MKINILGTDYEVIEQSDADNPKLEDANGLCEIWANKIILDTHMIEPHKMLVESPELFKEKVLRHEILHAFFAESGAMDWCNDEKLVDFLAVQFPKIAKTMINAGCLH